MSEIAKNIEENKKNFRDIQKKREQKQKEEREIRIAQWFVESKQDIEQQQIVSEQLQIKFAELRTKQKQIDADAKSQKEMEVAAYWDKEEAEAPVKEEKLRVAMEALGVTMQSINEKRVAKDQEAREKRAEDLADYLNKENNACAKCKTAESREEARAAFAASVRAANVQRRAEQIKQERANLDKSFTERCTLLKSQELAAAKLLEEKQKQKQPRQLNKEQIAMAKDEATLELKRLPEKLAEKNKTRLQKDKDFRTQKEKEIEEYKARSVIEDAKKEQFAKEANANIAAKNAQRHEQYLNRVAEHKASISKAVLEFEKKQTRHEEKNISGQSTNESNLRHRNPIATTNE